MSKSLTINTNPFTKQTNSLRGVPSGSTTPIDENVKWTPQTLTEEQKAQARENIGAAEAGETGGTTLYEFHYKRDASVEPTEYYIDADGYEPKEGDLMTIVWDWPFRTDENDPDAEFKNPALLKNNLTNPSIYIKNAHEMETDYDEIDPAVNTRWTVKLEKNEDVWYAYNISTIVQPNWNTLDSTLPSYIKGKPDISAPDFSKMSKIVFNMSSAGTAGMTYRTDPWTEKTLFHGNVYLDGTKVNTLNDLNAVQLAKGIHTIQYDYDIFPAVNKWNKVIYSEAGAYITQMPSYGGDVGLILQDPRCKTATYYGGTTDSVGLYTNMTVGGLKVTTLYTTQKNYRAVGLTTRGQTVTKTLYVPKDTGKYWRIVNPNVPNIYEYDLITYGRLGTAYCYGTESYRDNIPKVFGLTEIPFDSVKYEEPFYIKNTSNTTETATLSQTGTPNTVEIEYSTDNETWTVWGSTGTTPLTMSLNPNDKVYLRATTTKYANDVNNYHTLTGVDTIGGNILSLIYGSNFNGRQEEAAESAFIKFFYQNTELVNAKNLVIAIRNNMRFMSLFEGCTNLVYAPEIIYSGESGVNLNLFKDCESMTDGPELLLQGLGDRTDNTNNQAFQNCSALTSIKVHFISGDVSAMFDGCSSLNYIDASDYIGKGSTQISMPNWTRGVAATGTFIAAAGSNWSTGVNGIPTGWTVIYK